MRPLAVGGDNNRQPRHMEPSTSAPWLQLRVRRRIASTHASDVSITKGAGNLGLSATKYVKVWSVTRALWLARFLRDFCIDVYGLQQWQKVDRTRKIWSQNRILKKLKVRYSSRRIYIIQKLCIGHVLFNTDSYFMGKHAKYTKYKVHVWDILMLAAEAATS